MTAICPKCGTPLHAIHRQGQTSYKCPNCGQTFKANEIKWRTSDPDDPKPNDSEKENGDKP